MSQTPANEQRYDTVLEVVAALLLGLATSGSAWCAFQATRWHDKQGMEARAADVAQTQAVRRFTYAIQRIAYDAGIAAEYARAVAEWRTDLLDFYRYALVRPEFLPVIDAWLAQVRSGQSGASNLFENVEYIDQQLDDARSLDAEAGAAAQRGQEASEIADGYVQLTVFMAIALFFAGIKSNFRHLQVRVAILAVSALILVVSAVNAAGLSIA